MYDYCSLSSNCLVNGYFMGVSWLCIERLATFTLDMLYLHVLVLYVKISLWGYATLCPYTILFLIASIISFSIHKWLGYFNALFLCLVLFIYSFINRSRNFMRKGYKTRGYVMILKEGEEKNEETAKRNL